MKKYKILQDTMAGGSKVHAGDVIELPEHEGHSLCGYGKAEIHVAKHRQGATGVSELLWDGPTTSFLPIESNKITLPEF